MNITIDSSVFLSAFEKNDSAHKESCAFFNALTKREHQVIIPLIVLLEVMHNIEKYAPNTKEARLKIKFVKKAFNAEEFHIAELNKYFLKDFEKYAKLFRKLKTFDCIIAMTSYLVGSYLISWDKKLINNAKRYVKAYTPTEFLRKL